MVFPSAAQADQAVSPNGTPTPARMVLRVEVERVESTPYYPKPDHECTAELRCIQMYFWAKYRARVIEVVAGPWSRSDVEFLHLEHAQYVEELLRDCYVVLRPSGAKLRESLPLDWVAAEIVSEGFGGGPRIKALRQGQ